MTTAQIAALAFIFIAITDAVLCYAWLLPKLKKDEAPEVLALLTPEEKEKAKQKHKSTNIIKVVMDIWIVLALAIAYFLWNNPDILN